MTSIDSSSSIDNNRTMIFLIEAMVVEIMNTQIRWLFTVLDMFGLLSLVVNNERHRRTKDQL